MKVFGSGGFAFGSPIAYALVMVVSLLVLLVIGWIFPDFSKWLAVVAASYVIVDGMMLTFNRLFERFTTFWQRIVPMLLGILVSALVADWYVSRLIPVLDAYSMFLRDLFGATLALGAVLAALWADFVGQ